MGVLRSLLAAAVVAVVLVGCGGGSEAETTQTQPRPEPKPQSFDVTLDGVPSLETAGIFVAQKRGYFADVGLEVNTSSPVTPLNVVGYVTEEVIDLGISHQPQVVMAREKGAPVVAVAGLVKEPTMAMIWLKKAGIDGIADLKGKTVAIVGFPFEVGFLESFLAQAGLSLDDVRVKRVSYQLVTDLVSGRADAIFGGSGEVEGAELEAHGLEPVVMPVRWLGVPPYEELVLIGHPDRLSRDPGSIRAFLSALARGTAAAAEDPEAAAAAVAAARAELEISDARKPKPTKAEVEAVLPHLSRTGHMDSDQAIRLADWMREEGLIKRALPASALLTNRYVVP